MLYGQLTAIEKRTSTGEYHMTVSRAQAYINDNNNKLFIQRHFY